MSKQKKILPVEQLLTPAEAAAMFRVDVRTLSRWARAGQIPCRFTLGKHRRYRLGDVNALLQFEPVADVEALIAAGTVAIAVAA